MRSERGQALLEFALLLPVAVLLMLGFADMMYAIVQAGSVSAIAVETARCLALNGPQCNSKSAVTNYVASQASGLAIPQAQSNLSVVASACQNNECAVTLRYVYPRIGIYFPPTTIVRTGYASQATPPEGP